ncbi:serine/threonine-protein kinase [Streptomyces sp. NPDC059534]|uniref:serine/threonine-protein kinase n=1 Tax=Streptomyces sp. NPDC059534 TaxID=3346859 RepID=UPI0036CFB2F3
MTGKPWLRPLQGDDPERLGPYRLIGRVGAGGMGRVYLGRTVSGRLVAVKTLLAEGEVGESDRRRFAREAALARRVTGMFTVPVLDADADGPRPWMATEYVPAPSLAELVRDGGALPPAAVRWIAAGTAEALMDLHRAGIVHRDVKPGNVLLPLSGPRLIDFGISHALDLTRTSLTLGTIAFTSPEQARGEASTPASDVYALGATLFHLATGQPPYEPGADAFLLLARVQRAEVALDGLPRALDDLIRPLLLLAPEARPTPADVLAAFEREPVGGSELLPTAWTSRIRSHQAYEPPTRPDDLRPAARPAAPPAPAPSVTPETPATPAPAQVPEPPVTPEPSVMPESAGAPQPPRPPRTPRPVHHATTRTAPPERMPARAPVPDAAPAPAARRARRLWVPLAAAITAAVLVGGYVVYDRLGDDDPAAAVGDCLSNTRKGPGSYTPTQVRRDDCSASGARLTVTALPGPDGSCPDEGRPSERLGTRNLCVGPHVREGDCLDVTKGVSGVLPVELLWTVRPCGGTAPELRVVDIAESVYNLEDCGPAYSSTPDSLPWTETSRTDYCLSTA